jgi:hypothetical protein
MAIDFPASPTLNDVFTVGNVTYVWDGTKWTASVTGGISLDKIEEGNTSAEVIDTGSDGRFVVTTEGTERLRVTNTGLVGIGTNSPGQLLDVAGVARFGVNATKLTTYSDSTYAGFFNGSSLVSNESIYMGGGNTYFYNNGSPSATILSSGNVGIGTTSPVVQLHIQGTTGASLRIQAGSTSAAQIDLIPGGTSNPWYIWADNTRNLVFQDFTAERMRIDSSGRVGIGTSSPGYRLDVTSQLGCTHSGAIRHLVNIDSDGGKSYWYNGTPANTAYILGDTGGAYFAGNVGIGTTSPAKKLDVYEGSTGNVEQYLRNTTINLLSKIDGTTGAQFGTETSHPLVLLTANSERARIDNSGRLLVGTSSSAAGGSRLQIEGTGYYESSASFRRNSNDASAPALRLNKSRGTSTGSYTAVQNGDVLGLVQFSGSDGTDDETGAQIACEVDGTPGANDMPGRLVFSTTADGASTPTERMRITNRGSLQIKSDAGIDTVYLATPTGAGTSVAILRGSHSASSGYVGTDCIYIYANGNVVNTNNSYGAISDIKLKENIVDASSQWDDLKDLRVVNYNFKEGQTHTQIGLSPKKLNSSPLVSSVNPLTATKTATTLEPLLRASTTRCST